MNQAKSQSLRRLCHPLLQQTQVRQTGAPGTSGKEKRFRCWREKVLRLTRTVLDLQSSVAGVSENLKHAVQDDASKMLASMAQQPPPAQRPTAPWVENQAVPAPGILNNKESGMKDIKSELAEVKDALKTKSDKLEELDGSEGLRRAAQTAPGGRPGLTVTMTTSELFQAYVDSKIDALRRSSWKGWTELADLKNSCEYKLIGFQQHCDDYGSSYLGVIELIGEEGGQAEKKSVTFQAQVQDPPAHANCCDGTKPE